MKFEEFIKKLFSKKKPILPNLSPFHAKLLEDLVADDQIVYTVADKGLGICAVGLHKYMKWCIKHLKDPSSYEILTEEQAWKDIHLLKESIYKWTVKFRPEIGDDAVQYIRKKLRKDILDPFAYFYVMPKIHKPGPKGSKTRPVSSSCNSLQQPLSKWLNEILLPFATSQKLYINNSFEFKRDLIKTPIDPSYYIYTYDAVELYPSIPIDMCLSRISTWLENKKGIKGKLLEVICQALEIVLKNNRLVCGDLFAKQIRGIATGTSPATSIANLFLGIFEENEIIEQFKDFTPFLKQFIDDGCGIWKPHPDPVTDESQWQAFKAAFSRSEVKWIFSERKKYVFFS